MTTTKLILVEGLPGAGKSTTAQLAGKLLAEQGYKVRLFLEGGPDHPADYEATACMTADEYARLLHVCSGEQREIVEEAAFKCGGEIFIPYGSIERKTGKPWSEDIRQLLAEKDVYELPLAQNRRVIANRWRRFSEVAQQDDAVTVFECCFIQNPVTMGMIKYGASAKDVNAYVIELLESILPLDPLLIYVGQRDVEFTFRKALQERPGEWSEGFIRYYNEQGYGKAHGASGVEGTIRVLEARAELERSIVEGLAMDKAYIDNSAYDPGQAEQELRTIIEKHITGS
ncbi:hypothetical protein [Paenibacillus tepidiphilus]|uniref:hypothetical protein n=1 Tax=Paenibacillus tepidiphilus TaxID=2608683 RepID=UPI00123AA9B9|nr:hypothetical protein [Paenibacillus tepidiphilus]